MKVVKVDEQYQRGYQYVITEPEGKNFRSDFKPDLTPEQMLKLGVFSGDYFNEVPKEFPADWFDEVFLAERGNPNPKTNYFKVSASQSLRTWQKNGWINEEDPKGWFLWYCRYYMGRRIPEEDDRQIKRWQAMKRHVSQLRVGCRVGDELCQPRRRQALLHWAYDSRRL